MLIVDMWKFFVKNYSQYSGRFFFRHKILITFILFFSFSFFNFLGAEDYYFVNDSTITPSSGDATGAGDGKWSNAANWNTQMDGSGDVAAAAPGSADNVFFIKRSRGFCRFRRRPFPSGNAGWYSPTCRFCRKWRSCSDARSIRFSIWN